MATVTRADIDIQQDVLEELRWDPQVKPTEVGVEVDDGVVTLTGTVDNYMKKWAAERAALRVAGVRAVANDVTVKTGATRTDTDIAKAVADALESNILVPKNRIKVTVKNGWVTLEGDVDWRFEREEAEECRPRAAERRVFFAVGTPAAQREVEQPPPPRTGIGDGGRGSERIHA